MKFADIITKAFEDEKSEYGEGKAKHDILNEEKARDGLLKLGVKHGYTVETIGNETIVSFSDGIILKPIFNDRRRISWRLKGQCPNCNQTSWSAEVDTLARMGGMYNAFCPNNAHLRKCLRIK